MARLQQHGLRRTVGVPGLFATAYGNVGSSIYYALGLVAVHALGLPPDLTVAQAPCRMNVAEWENLGRVADYLRSHGVRDGDLTCYHNTTLALYLQLGVRPATPDVAVDLLVSRFPHR